MKVLVVPSRWITSYSKREQSRWMGVAKDLLRLDTKGAKEKAKAHMLCTEVQHYGDLPKVLGRENTFIVGEYYPEYTLAELPADTRYPSLHKTPRGTAVTPAQALAMIKDFDAVVVGARSGISGEQIRLAAKKASIPVVLMDYFDHLEVYHQENVPLTLLTRGLEKDRDFDLYAKHDLPIGRAESWLFSVAPMPVRSESFPALGLEKDMAVFYRGQSRPGVLRDDRGLLADAVATSVPGAVIDNQKVLKTAQLIDYWKLLARAKVTLCPSGKVWDSTRHCESAMFGCVPVLPEPDCETVNHLVRDGDNCIAYQVERSGQGLRIKDLDRVVLRIRDITASPSESERMAKRWAKEVEDFHTTFARAKILVQKISALRSGQ